MAYLNKYNIATGTESDLLKLKIFYINTLSSDDTETFNPVIDDGFYICLSKLSEYQIPSSFIKSFVDFLRMPQIVPTLKKNKMVQNNLKVIKHCDMII